jgi:hypothetical protein
MGYRTEKRGPRGRGGRIFSTLKMEFIWRLMRQLMERQIVR